jgi:hypothetical protein
MDRFTTLIFSISSISDLSEFIPLFVWVLYSKRGMPYSILGIFFFFSSIIKLVTLVTAEMTIYNMPAFHILACLEISMLFCFYSFLTYQRINFWGVGVLLLINVFNTLYLQPVTAFNSIAWTINMMVLIVMGLAYLFRLYKNEDDYTPLEKRPDFIITTGFLIYASGSLFTYLMGTEILSGKPEGFFNNAWIFQSVSNICKNAIVSYGLWLTR